MARITNLGMKRTYVKAGFGPAEEKEEGGIEGERSQQPPKKRRKRNRGKPEGKDDSATPNHKFKSSNYKNQHDGTDKRSLRQDSSEQRRLKRIQERESSTTCLICREKGHTARDCRTKSNVVGMCYRCGSRRHNLSRCKKPIDELRPLPFALCFVCHGKGHLASTCPENREKGVYPNGGSCKLCGETSHLAKNCGLRRQDVQKTSIVLGTGTGAGADEDDFHILNRKKREVDREEKREEKKKRGMDVKEGVHTGVVKVFAERSLKRKVVHF